MDIAFIILSSYLLGSIPFGLIVARHMDSDAALAGGFAVLGHVFPVWLRFKGGKGVATSLGVLFALQWELGAVAGAIWLMVFACTRIASVAALIALSYTPIAAYML